MGNLAIIPARGGSKRIPEKNIKPFLGDPIIGYSIKAALNTNTFEAVMVSTNDVVIAEKSKAFGASVPFLRSEDNANDFAVLADVILEVLTDYAKTGKTFTNVCCILPTAPFVTSEKITKALELLTNNNFETVFPVLEYSFPIQRSLKIEDDKVSMVWEEHLNTRSQDLESRYHDAGQFYWINVEAFLKSKKIFTSNSGSIVVSALEAQDIDTETDWKLAEMKYKLMVDDQKNPM